MPGQPLKSKVRAALHTRAERELGEGADLLEFACQFIAGGGRISQLAQETARELGVSVSRPLVSGILNGLSDGASERLAAARREGAAALVEEAAQIADEAEPTSGAVQKAGLQVRTRQWMAERFDPQSFSEKTPLVNVSIGSLMLEALQQPPPPPPADFGAVLVATPAEIVSED